MICNVNNTQVHTYLPTYIPTCIPTHTLDLIYEIYFVSCGIFGEKHCISSHYQILSYNLAPPLHSSKINLKSSHVQQRRLATLGRPTNNGEEEKEKIGWMNNTTTNNGYGKKENYSWQQDHNEQVPRIQGE